MEKDNKTYDMIRLATIHKHGKSKKWICEQNGLTLNQLNDILFHFDIAYRRGLRQALGMNELEDKCRKLNSSLIKLQSDIDATDKWIKEREWRLKK